VGGRTVNLAWLASFAANCTRLALDDQPTERNRAWLGKHPAVQLLRSRGALMADARATVGHWVGEQDGRLQWLRPEAGAFCCARLNPEIFDPPGVRRFYDRLAEGRTVVAPGPWFGDSAHVMRIGLAYQADGQLEKGLEVISDALRL
jgi:DNA-binding transcriptional MocR family regulator